MSNLEEVIDLQKRLAKGLELMESFKGTLCKRPEQLNPECSGCFLSDEAKVQLGVTNWCKIKKTWHKLNGKYKLLYRTLTEEEKEKANG